MIPDSETLERALHRCARAGERLRLRRFALGCATAVMAERDPSPLWAEAVQLIEARVAGGLVADESRPQKRKSSLARYSCCIGILGTT